MKNSIISESSFCPFASLNSCIKYGGFTQRKMLYFLTSNYTKSPLIQIDDLPSVKYDIQAMHKRLTQIGFEVKQIENISKDQIIPALEDNASLSPCDAINIVYFTGHGGHNNGNNYIYPVDFSSKFEKSRDIKASAMNIQDIISLYKAYPHSGCLSFRFWLI